MVTGMLINYNCILIFFSALEVKTIRQTLELLENLVGINKTYNDCIVSCLKTVDKINNVNYNNFNLQVPRHSRQCNSLAWNPVENNLVSPVEFQHLYVIFNFS